MPSSGVSVTISAEDRATKTLDNVNRRLKQMSAPVERTQKAFNQLASNSGLTGVVRATRDISTFTDQAFVNISRTIPAAASLAGALSAAGAVAALVAIMKASAAAGNQLQQLSAQSGVTAESLQRIGAAASAAGGDAQGAVQGTADLAKNIALLMHTGRGSPEFMAGLALLGVSLKDTNGNARTTSDVLDDILHKLAAIKDPQQRAAEGAMALGDAYKSFAFELNDGVAGLDAYQARAKKMTVASDEQIAALAKLQGSFNVLSGDITGLEQSIAGDLAPATTAMIGHMSDWIEANHKWLEADITSGIKALATDAAEVAKQANSVAQALGGWKTVAEAIVAIKLGSWAIAVAARLTPLSLAVLAILETINKINSFTERTQAKNLPADSPFWRGVSDQEQGNYLNSPRSQDFVRWSNTQTARMGNGPSGAPPKLPTSAELQSNMETVRRTLKADGWSDAQVAGILANVSAESGFDPQAVGDNGQAFGLEQLHPDRVALANQWISRATNGAVTDFRKASVAQQAEFINYELNTSEKAAGDRIRQENTARGAAFADSKYNERPAGGDETAAMRAQNGELFMPPPAPAPGPANGQIDVHVRHSNPPAGTGLSVTTNGNAFSGAPKVTTSMPDAGFPGAF